MSNDLETNTLDYLLLAVEHVVLSINTRFRKWGSNLSRVAVTPSEESFKVSESSAGRTL